MAFAIKQVVVACLDYKDCSDRKQSAKIEFDFSTNEVKFHIDDDYDEEKATFNIEDLRELVRVFDEQKALNPVQEKPKAKRKR